jgi:hypothetical protein
MRLEVVVHGRGKYSRLVTLLDRSHHSRLDMVWGATRTHIFTNVHLAELRSLIMPSVRVRDDSTATFHYIGIAKRQ